MTHKAPRLMLQDLEFAGFGVQEFWIRRLGQDSWTWATGCELMG